MPVRKNYINKYVTSRHYGHLVWSRDMSYHNLVYANIIDETTGFVCLIFSGFLIKAQMCWHTLLKAQN